jgi:serine/threonine-protein kinase
MQGGEEKKRQPAALWCGAPMPVPGDVIADKYRIEAVLGRGGMSVVYRATHVALEQQVAIKVLSAEALLLPEYVVRLKREARAVSRIRSEHVVRVHDIGELPGGGVPYLVMECLDGLDLSAVLARRGPFPVELAIECIMQACEALAEAHALGIIHRDLKPANLFLAEAVDGSPCIKVLDFGISRMSQRHGLSALTDPGIVLGTPSYMAPEQMEGAETVDARSDIWALGTILYELLVGKPPYSGESLPQLFVRIMRSPSPRPSAMRAGVRSALDDIVTRCREIDPEERFQTVAELAWALSSLGAPRGRDSAARISRVLDRQSTPPVSASTRSSIPPPMAYALRRWSKRVRRVMSHLGVALATVSLLCIASVVGVLVAREAPAPDTPPATLAAEGVVALAAMPAVASPAAPVRSRDGGAGPDAQGARAEKVGDPARPVRE